MYYYFCDLSFSNHELYWTFYTVPSPKKQEFRGANSTVPILLTQFKCSGDEDNIIQCEHSEFNEFNTCSHKDDVGVTCRGMYHAVADLGT